MSSAGTTQRHSADPPELFAAGDARRVLDAAEHDSHLARVLTYIEDELSDRLHTDVQDAPAMSADERVARRYRLLARMAERYRSAAEGRNRRSRSNACLMLAAMHRLAGSDRLRQV
jgi:hypothetical protein